MSNNNNDEEKLDKNLEKPQEEEEEDDKLILNSEIKDSDNDAGPAAIMGDDASEGEVAASQGEVAASRSDDSGKEEEEDDDQDALDQQKFLQWVRNRFGRWSKSNLRFGECCKSHLRFSECCKEILIEILTFNPICKFLPCYSSLNPLIDPCLDPCSCSGH